MQLNDTTSANTRKHHRIHPTDISGSSTNESPKGHTVLIMSSSPDDDKPSMQNTQPRSNAVASNSSSSIDIRATGLIKRVASPSATVSNTDEILPETFFRRMSNSFNVGALVQIASPSASTTNILPTIHDVNSIHTNDDNNTRSIDTAVTHLNLNENECEICYLTDECENLRTCKHNFCHSCLEHFLVDKIRAGCPLLLECPHHGCKEILHPDDIKRILNDPEMYERYETFMLKRVLQKIPDTRWCPYPNCNFAILVEDARKAREFNCLICRKPFCQRCSQIWHPNLSCETASTQRAAQDPTLEMLMKSSSNGGLIRPCPRCKSPIEKLDDGSCNHIRCAICTCEFCWLCMKEVDNLHFITPTGCTFYGKTRWSRRKLILYLILLWILTPIIGIIIIIIAIPMLLIILPIIITKRFYAYSQEFDIGAVRKFCLCTVVFICTFIVTPFILILSLLIGIPLILFFIYFYMPRRFLAANL